MYLKKNRLGMISALVLSFFLLQLSPAFAAKTTSVNNAQIISDTIPATMVAEKTYSVSITVKNTGSTTWTNSNSYRLTAVGGSDSFTSDNQYLRSTDSIAPGKSKTFTVRMKAPSTAGTYTTEWRMTQGSKGQFGQTLTGKVKVTDSDTTAPPTTPPPTTPPPTTPPAPLTTAVSSSSNDAQIISSTIPTTMAAGKTYSVSIKAKNTGSTTWTNSKSYRLTAVGGSDSFTSDNQYLKSTDSIAPGESKTFTVQMKAPSTAGTYTTEWRMTQSSKGQFGQTLTAKVIVTTGSSTTPTNPTPTNPTPTNPTPTNPTPTNPTPTNPTPTDPAPIKVPAGSYNVKDYGAKGNGVADDTAAINSAISYAYSKGGGTVFIPDGTYMINVSNSSSVNLKSNIKLMLSDDATLKAKPTSSSLYAIVKVSNGAKNVEVTGGRIVGDRYNHLSSSGEHGRGIQITGASDVRVTDVSISDSWGDGIYIGSSSSRNYSDNIVIEGVKIDNNRRSGITVISAKALTIRDVVINKTNGTLPQCGLNFEPNYNTDFLQNILVEDLKVTNCVNYGLQISLGRYANSPNTVGITIKNYTSINNRLPLKDYSKYTAPAYKLNIKVI